MKINKTFLVSLLITLSLCIFQIINFINAPQASAASLWEMQEGRTEIGQKFGQSDTPPDIRDVVISAIKIFLTFLGLIFLILIIWAGFKWMTAAGNEDRVKEAKSQIGSAIIGMLIVLAAYVIVSFTVSLFNQGLSGSVWPY